MSNGPSQVVHSRQCFYPLWYSAVCHFRNSSCCYHCLYALGMLGPVFQITCSLLMHLFEDGIEFDSVFVFQSGVGGAYRPEHLREHYYIIHVELPSSEHLDWIGSEKIWLGLYSRNDMRTNKN